MADHTLEFLLLWLEMRDLRDNPAYVHLAERASRLNALCLGEVSLSQSLCSIERQDEPDLALRHNLKAFIRVETALGQIRRVIDRALANCGIIMRETDLEGKSMITSLSQAYSKY